MEIIHHRLKTESSAIVTLGIELEIQKKFVLGRKELINGKTDKLTQQQMPTISLDQPVNQILTIQSQMISEDDVFWTVGVDSGNLIEIRFQPCSLAFLTANQSTLLKLFRILHICEMHDCYSGSGIHIHITKSHLSDERWTKIFDLCYNMQILTADISERWDVNNGYWSQSYYKGSKQEPISSAPFMRYNQEYATNEFRLFKSTMDINKFLRNAEFIQSLVDYAKSAKILDNIDCTSIQYITFVYKNKEDYPNLFNWLDYMTYVKPIHIESNIKILKHEKIAS